jgi:hypothetical protein
MVRGHRLAVLAKDAIGIEIVLEPFEAGHVIGKLCLEGFLTGSAASWVCGSMTFTYKHRSSDSTYCQGIITAGKI